jgi:hypothetical protein
MGTLYLYATTFLSHWWPLVSAGSLLGLEEFCERYWSWAKNRLEKVPGHWRGRLKVSALVLAAIWSGYLAWSDEHSALVAMTEQKDQLQSQLQTIPAQQQKTIDDLKTELDKAKNELLRLQQASRLPNHVYQDDMDIAMVGNVSYDRATGILVFGLLTSQAPVDFSKELRFQNARIFCENSQPLIRRHWPNTRITIRGYGSAAMGAALNLEYSHVVCHVLGPAK